MHDVSVFAQSFDATNDGGVKRAVAEWVKTNGIQPLFLNSHIDGGGPDDLVYRDGCGLGIIQKQV